MKPLYEKSLYLNRDIDYLFNNEIIEYDMREAGYSLIREYKLLSNDVIDKLSKYSKDKRTIRIGMIQRENNDFKNKLKEAFSEARKIFFNDNDLYEENILSIKKDAIFVRNKRCKSIKFGNYIEFRPKNVYTSYMLLDNNEYYFNKRIVDVKGISEKKLKPHIDYMLDFLVEFVNLRESNNIKMTQKYLRDFLYYYRNKELEIGYYRELNKKSMYTLFIDNRYVDSDLCDTLENVNIMYNYLKLLLPIINIIV